MKKLNKKIGTLFLICLFLMTACAKSDSKATSESDYFSKAETGFTSGTISENSDTNSGSNGELISQKLIKTVNLNLETLVFDETIQFIDQKVKEFGGYIEESKVTGNSIYTDYMRNAYMTVRIPSERLDEFVNLVGDNTTITGKYESAKDITSSYIDTQSRKKSLEIQQERLFALLEKAENMEDIIALEERISQVTYELENYTSTLQTYDNLVEYSSITISLNEVERTTHPESSNTWERMKNGLADSLYDIKEGIKNISVWFISNIPYLIIWAAIVTIIIIIVKKHRNKINHINTKKEE